MNSFMDNKDYLFVYGTLRSQMNDPLHRLLETHAVLVGTGTFQGKLTILVVIPESSGRVGTPIAS